MVCGGRVDYTFVVYHDIFLKTTQSSQFANELVSKGFRF